MMNDTPFTPFDQPDTAHVEEANAPVTVPETTTGSNWHVEAGRKGARRIHQLIQQGKLYEQEHGLKSGRQRLRQLIEEGKLYEKEHGLAAEVNGVGRERRIRLSNDKALAAFLHLLLRLAKPSVRARLIELAHHLETPAEPATTTAQAETQLN
jgi:hypothetical protein